MLRLALRSRRDASAFSATARLALLMEGWTGAGAEPRPVRRLRFAFGPERCFCWDFGVREDIFNMSRSPDSPPAIAMSCIGVSRGAGALHRRPRRLADRYMGPVRNALERGRNGAPSRACSTSAISRRRGWWPTDNGAGGPSAHPRAARVSVGRATSGACRCTCRGSKLVIGVGVRTPGCAARAHRAGASPEALRRRLPAILRRFDPHDLAEVRLRRLRDGLLQAPDRSAP